MAWDTGTNSTLDSVGGRLGSIVGRNTGTSIAISLRTMSMCQQKLAELGVQATMRALYVEQGVLSNQPWSGAENP